MPHPSYLFPEHSQAEHHYFPEPGDLEDHWANRVTQEWLNQMHHRVLSARKLVGESESITEMKERRGIVKGLETALELLQNIADEVVAGVRREDGDKAEGAE